MNSSKDATDEEVSEDLAAKKRHHKLSYALNSDFGVASVLIQAFEWVSGKPKLLRAISRFEKLRNSVDGNALVYAELLQSLNITVDTTEAQAKRIPADGPVIVVANQPHGDLDALVVAHLIAQRRSDFRLIGRSKFWGPLGVGHFYIEVPAAGDPEAQRKIVEMRFEAMKHLREGGLVAIFPSGQIASSDTISGEAKEADWTPFVAKMVQRSGASVVPIGLPGSNSKVYQIARHISPLFGRALLLNQITRLMNTVVKPVIGPTLRNQLAIRINKNPRGAMEWLREQTLSLSAGHTTYEGVADPKDDDENTDDPGPMISGDGKDL